MNRMDEEFRIIREYEARDNRLPWNNWKTNIYHPRHPIGRLFHEHNHDVLVDMINQLDLDLTNLKILDVGCGYGSWLRYLVELGATPENCIGVDLSEHRIELARHKNPALLWYRRNIDDLNFAPQSFDLVMQSVVFSSILDAHLRVACASEMQRVTKNGGLVLWVDLLRSKSETLVSFSESDVKQYFPQMHSVYQKRVHPKYFRRLHGKNAWLSRLIYHFTKLGCESQLIALRNS